MKLVVDLAEHRKKVREKAEATPPLVSRYSYKCRHRYSVVDSNARKVLCAKCDVELDPIDVLHSLARDGDRLVDVIKRRKELEKSCDALLTRERRAKARVRRWEGKGEA